MAQQRDGPAEAEGGGDRDWEALSRERFGIEHLELPPRLDASGNPNPEHFRAIAMLISSAGLGQLYGDPDKAAELRRINLNHQITALERSCSLHGFDPKHIVDARSQAEKALDAAEKLQRIPRSDLELLDDEIEALEDAMDTADELCVREVEDRLRNSLDRFKDLRGDSSPKAWRARIGRIRRLKNRARHDIPKGTPRDRRDGVDAAHLLRYMIYVGRSSAVRGEGPKLVYKVYPHMAYVSVGLWEAEKRVGFVDGEVVRGAIPYEGVIVQMGPGFGKTTIVNHWAARRMSRSPRDTGVFLHAKEDKAQESLSFCANYFTRDNEGGRRNLALHPGLRVYRKNTEMLHLDCENRTKSPTAEATAVMTKGLGSDHLWQLFDDCVPQSDAEQETERKRRYDRIHGTWFTRQRGNEAFWIMTGYPWHKGDALCRLEDLARREAQRVARHRQQGQSAAREAVFIRVIKLPCGGPESSPKFRSICPEIASPAKLRSVYVRSADVYAANYQLKPRDEASRIIARLRFYDPRDGEHERFVRTSINHLSLDPAATNHGRGDKAGTMLLGQGDVRTEEGIERRLRILTAEEIVATQTELVNFLAAFCQKARVDYVHCETRSGFVATAEMIENRFGIDVIRYDPGRRSKGERLRAVAPMINDGNAHLGARACVEFPGRRDDDGRLVPDVERYGALYEQVLDFGTAAQDHLVDCLTQVCNYLMPQMDVGLGALSDRVREAVDEESHLIRARRELLEKARNPDRKRDRDREETEFFA